MKPITSTTAVRPTNKGAIVTGRSPTSTRRSSSDFAAAYVDRGGIYELKGNYDRALADSNQAAKLDPDYRPHTNSVAPSTATDTITTGRSPILTR
jgi:tetratricopeptide (TPR) repeat protein